MDKNNKNFGVKSILKTNYKDNYRKIMLLSRGNQALFNGSNQRENRRGKFQGDEGKPD